MLHDISPFFCSDHYYYIKNNLKFLKDLGDGATFKLVSTDYYLYITEEGYSWYFFPEEYYMPANISFRELFDSVDESIQEELIFNINFFKIENDNIFIPYLLYIERSK